MTRHQAGRSCRRRLIQPIVAAGPFQAHTLAVNEVGIAFLRAARQRGHLFGAESWQHEVAHDLRISPRQPRDFLVADAFASVFRRLDDDGDVDWLGRQAELTDVAGDGNRAIELSGSERSPLR